ncbi:hypothetical protein M8J77_024751 [Diaphorina citri]|nr:hypothetical protein M8J77_024751 [Diaphorina citri]
MRSSAPLVLIALLTTLVTLASKEVQSKIKPGRGRGSNWWGIAKAGEPNNLLPMSPGMAYMDPTVHSTLRRKQRRLVRENPGVLLAVSKGANLAINECQFQFRNRRWNCSTRNFLRGKNLFGKIVDRAQVRRSFHELGNTTTILKVLFMADAPMRNLMCIINSMPHAETISV